MGRSGSDEKLGADGTRLGEPAEPVTGTAQLQVELEASAVIDGKYRLDKILGEGGMGSVWQAHNLQLDVPVAIKLLRAGPDTASLSERMKLEARSAARLVHPAIVRVFDIDTAENGDPYIVMELLNGESLADLLDRGRLSTIHAVQTLLPICEALVLAHGKGIVHRDLKPQNVFMSEETERLQPKLLDFGIAKLVNATSPAGNITDTGVLLGSPDYMSPEQARGQSDLDHRTDIWSFSVMLYEAITGITPFQGDNYNALMRAIIDDPPLPIPREVVVGYGLQEIILRGLSKDREGRPSSMQALGRELAHWLQSQGVHEDVTGGTLEVKWTGRGHQRSVPVIANDEHAPSLPPPATSDATLISASHPEPHARRSEDLVARAQRRPSPLPWIMAGLLLAGGVLWALVGSSSEPADSRSNMASAANTGASNAASAAAQPKEASPASSLTAGSALTSPSAAPAQLAVTPPSPSLNPAPPLSAPARALPPREKAPTPSHSATATPPPRDDDHELLQAY